MKRQREGIFCYEFRKRLPETIKHVCDAPDDFEHYRKRRLYSKPDNYARYVKYGPYPDPPEPSCVAVRGFLRHHSPNLFSESAIKDTLEVQKSKFMAWRKVNLRKYCKEHNLSFSSYADPIEPKEPSFAPFGPQNNWFDKIDRRFRADEITPSGMIRAFSWAAIVGTIIGLLSSWLLVTGVPLEQLIGASIFIIVVYYLEKRLADSVYCLGEIRRTHTQPDVFVFEKGRLSCLLKNLKFAESELKHYFPSALTAITKTRTHPNKNAYSIKMVSHLMLNELISPLFTRPEILTFNIEIVAESTKGPPILCYWFDPPKSIWLARRSLPVINFIRDRMDEMKDDMNEHSKMLILYNRTSADAKVDIEYGPIIFTV